MRLRQATCRNRTTATMRITWLLLSLSFLFHCDCSEHTNTMTSKSTTKHETSTPTIPVANSHDTSVPITGISQSAPVATLAGTTSKLIDSSTTTQPKTTNTQTHNASTSPSPDKGGVTSTPATTSSTKKTTVPYVTNRAQVESSTTDTNQRQTPDNISKVSTANPTTTQQATTTAHKTTSPGNNDGRVSSLVETTTQTVTTNIPSKSKAPQLPGGPTAGTTSSPITTPTHTTLRTTTGLTTPTAITSTATSTSITTTTKTTTTTTTSTISAEAQLTTLHFSLNDKPVKEEQKDLVEVCKRLMVNMQDGNCSLTWRHHNNKIQFDSVQISGKVNTSLAAQHYEELTKKGTDNTTLISILASCGALLIMLIILTVCASHHRKSYNENQQHLTEELHTVENGYHDNPTLEVMEVQPEMQEKKVALNGEFNDSWIVPIDNLLKEDIPDEEDTHL